MGIYAILLFERKLRYFREKLNVIPKNIKRDYYKPVKTLGPGSHLNIGLNFWENNEEDGFNSMFIQVFNPTNKEIPVEEAIIVAVSANGELSYYEGDPNKIGTPKTAFILPKGIAPFDDISKVKELYGEASEVIKDKYGMFNNHIYKTKDNKILVFEEAVGKVNSFLMRIPMKADFYEEVKKLESYNDFSKTLDKNSFININGIKIKLYTPFKDAVKGLNLQLNRTLYKDGETFENIKVKPRTETTVRVDIPGYDYEMLYFRVVNMTEETINLIDSTVVGVNVTITNLKKTLIDPYEIPDPSNYLPEKNAMRNDLHVIAPLGIKLNEDQKSAFDKIPDNAVEKVFTKEGGAYSSVENEKVLLKVLSMPNREDKIIEDIMFTVKEIEKQ